MRDLVEQLSGLRVRSALGVTVERAANRSDLAAAHRLRQATFVQEQGLFAGTDRDDLDDLDETVVLVARDDDGVVVGSVRLAPAVPGRDLAWWTGSRLVVASDRRGAGRIGAALVTAACGEAERLGALRFEACVQRDRADFFARLGWDVLGAVEVAGTPHVRVRWPVGRIARLVAATKEPIAAILGGLRPGGDGWVGDDAAPVPGSDLLAACDAILPAMVERDPWWAGWCSVLVNVNDVAVKGAVPVGLLDAVGARTASQAARVLAGVKAGADAWGVPVLGGHTTLGVPASLAVTILGRAQVPVPGGGGRPGDAVTVVADLAGGWRPGHPGQWDSTTARSSAELRHLAGTVDRVRPRAAKDVSMAGIVGTIGMLAEAGGCGAVVDVAAVPTPAGAGLGAWLTCFPGFAQVLAGAPLPAGADVGPAVAATCGELVAGGGVALRWPDGEVVDVLGGRVTGLGPAGVAAQHGDPDRPPDPARRAARGEWGLAGADPTLDGPAPSTDPRSRP